MEKNREVLVEFRKEDGNGNAVAGPGGLIYSQAVPVNKIPVLDEDRYIEDILANRSQSLRIDTSDDNYVMFFNAKDEFLNKLISLLNTSPTVKSITKNKRRLTLGTGFIPHRGTVKTILAIWRSLLQRVGIEDMEVKELQEALCNVNLKGESLEDVIGDAVFDYYGLGNCGFEFVRGQEGGQRFFHIYHVPVIQYRPREEEDQIIREVGILDNWANATNNKDKIKKLPVFPEWKKDGNVERSVILMKDYSPGLIYWGLPDWASAILYAEIEYRIPRYNIAKFTNGYVPSCIVQFFGSVSKEEAKKIVDDFVAKFTDTKNNAKMFVQVLRDERLKANVQILEDKNDGSYMELAGLAGQAIVTASRWMMSLAGFATAGKLGSNEQMKQEFEVVENTVIEPVQNKFLTKVVNVYMKEMSEWVGKFKDINLTFAKATPVSFKGSLDVGSYITVNEGRDILGFEPLDGERGQRMISNPTTPQEQTPPPQEDDIKDNE